MHLLDDDHVRVHGKRICADHFEERMFLKAWLRTRLKKCAVPTVFRRATLSKRSKKPTIQEEQECETQALCAKCSRHINITEKKPSTTPSDDNATTYIKSEISEEDSCEFPLQLISVKPENYNETTYIKSEISDEDSYEFPLQLMSVKPENDDETKYIKSETSEEGSSEFHLQLMSVKPENDNETTYIKSETSEAGSSKIPLQRKRVHPKNIKYVKQIEEADQLIEDLENKLAFAHRQLEEVYTEEQMLRLCKIHLTPTLFLLIQHYMDNRDKKLEDFCYGDKILELAKALYLLCPANLYSNLESLIPLPPLCVIKPLLKPHEVHPFDSRRKKK